MTPKGIIWLASYPKSGNTWARLFLTQFLAAPGSEIDAAHIELNGTIASNRAALDQVIGISSSDLSDDESDRYRPHLYRTWANAIQPTDPPALVKVHDAYAHLDDGEPMFPPDATAAAVYLIRNPLDLVISYAFHAGDGDIDRTIRNLNDSDRAISGGKAKQLRQRMLDWSSHVQSWSSAQGFPVLVVRYEDLLASPANEFDKIVAFLGLSDGMSTDETAQRLHRAIDLTSFDRLRKAEATAGFQERTARQKRFFRSGRAGEWRETLSSEQIRRVVDAHRATMIEHGYLSLDGALA